MCGLGRASTFVCPTTVVHQPASANTHKPRTRAHPARLRAAACCGLHREPHREPSTTASCVPRLPRFAKQVFPSSAACASIIAVLLVTRLGRATRTAGCGLQHVWGIIVLLNAARTLIFRQVVRRAEVAETLDEAAGIAQVVPNIAETHPHML